MKNKKGFTLVELLAVIVILAIILVIAVPQIIRTIDASRLSAIKDSALLIATNAEKDYLSQLTLNQYYNATSIPCTDVVKLSDDYDINNCSILYDEKGVATVTLEGATGKKFNGITCTGTKDNMSCTRNGENSSSSGGSISRTAADTLIELCDTDCQNGTPTASNGGLIKVTHGTEAEYRYIGATPSNYATFNNETWRIIGIFNMPKIINDNGILTASETETEQRIKLIRDELIGNYSWDTSKSSVNGGFGINQWGPSKYTNDDDYEGADLMRELNTDYLNKGTGTVKWFKGQSKEEPNGDYELSKGLSSDAKLLVDNAIWYLGGGVDNLSLENQYKRERGIDGYRLGSQRDGVTRTTEWTGKVGLIYPSDFGYASANISCKDNLSKGDNCKDQNWLFNGNYYWTLTPCSGNAYYVQCVNSSGHVYSGNAYHANQVRPSVYLKSNVSISGDGSTTYYTFS